MKVTDSPQRFFEVAERYCAWAEGPASDSDLLTARKLLAELHLLAIELPNGECGKETEDVVSHESWRKVLDRFSELPLNLYWDVFDPLKEEPPVVNSLADDLADIYRDLKEGVILYGQGDIVEATWQWRFLFEIHWGAHLTGAQRAIHCYLTNY